MSEKKSEVCSGLYECSWVKIMYWISKQSEIAPYLKVS